MEDGGPIFEPVPRQPEPVPGGSGGRRDEEGHAGAVLHVTKYIFLILFFAGKRDKNIVYKFPQPPGALDGFGEERGLCQRRRGHRGLQGDQEERRKGTEFAKVGQSIYCC